MRLFTYKKVIYYILYILLSIFISILLINSIEILELREFFNLDKKYTSFAYNCSILFLFIIFVIICMSVIIPIRNRFKIIIKTLMIILPIFFIFEVYNFYISYLLNVDCVSVFLVFFISTVVFALILAKK